ncbi:uncharacterized protein LOC131362406 isoform X3 [Hemibagrus wyckioides]|uniref:uncharacterized protein LOC131362406 isoform X3 n=1 Tax=Hemibagrus wyckioides TaxID=337641 RepID=UPI00266D4E3E|nr:uncharacterized protein LOC131362406 isoform X3 [Hemibagrus wyckioides]
MREIWETLVYYLDYKPDEDSCIFRNNEEEEQNTQFDPGESPLSVAGGRSAASVLSSCVVERVRVIGRLMRNRSSLHHTAKFFTMEILFLLFCVQIFVGTGFTYTVPSDIPAAVLQDQDFEMETREFSEMQINTTCEALSTGSKYNYSAPNPDFLQQKDCELSWKEPDGTVLKYGGVLILETCEDGIRLFTHCLDPKVKVECVFNIIKSTTSAPPYESPVARIGSIVTGIVFLILLVAVVLFLIWRFK